MQSDVLVEKEKAIFESSCFAHCQFLVSEYGFRVVETGSGLVGSEIDIRVVYQNETTGISFQTISYGHELGVSLYQLVDGQRSMEEGSVYGLDWIIMLRCPSRKRSVKVNLYVSSKRKPYIKDSNDFAAEDWQEKSARFDRAFAAYTAALQECAADVLRGDFTIFEELRQLRPGQWYDMWNKWDKVSTSVGLP